MHNKIQQMRILGNSQARSLRPKRPLLIGYRPVAPAYRRNEQFSFRRQQQQDHDDGLT